MLTAYIGTERGLVAAPLPDRPSDDLVWIDLLTPTREEEHAVQDLLRIEVPTREEMREIEVSSRLYEDNGALYMTATLVVNAESDRPSKTDVTFILTGSRLVTVRYDEPRPLEIYAARACKSGSGLVCDSGEAVIVGLIDAIVDRLADLLERAGDEIEIVSGRVFARQKSRARRSIELEVLLRRVGAAAELNSRVGESLHSIGRLVAYLGAQGDPATLKDVKVRLKSAQRDLHQLVEHAGYLAEKIAFLLDAVIGMISIEQNGIIKIFAIASVVLMPPTLIASIYGMNFQHMPELAVWWAYPAALFGMLLSAVLPFLLFRAKGWL